MNKQIKEFMLEAERYALKICGFCGHEDYNDIRNEKFAELIIKECAHVGFVTGYPGNGVDVSQAIKQHFGVE